MAIEIRETFQVQAPIDAVWRFVMDPEQIAACMPGAVLEAVVDERTFLGSIKVQLGAITISYKGRIQLTDVDDQGYAVRMEAEGRETGGGTAKASMSSSLRALPDGQTEVTTEASIDLTGRIMQVGRGMIQGVSQQLFQQFVARAKARMEAPAGAAEEAAATETEAIRVVPLIFRVLWSSVSRFFRRLFRRQAS